MLFECKQCIVVGKDSYKTKAGTDRYSITLANGSGQPVKLNCTFEQLSMAVPLTKGYEITANFDTNGYDIYGDLLSISEMKQK